MEKPYRVRPGLYRYKGRQIVDVANYRAGDSKPAWSVRTCGDSRIFDRLKDACAYVDERVEEDRKAMETFLEETRVKIAHRDI